MRRALTVLIAACAALAVTAPVAHAAARADLVDIEDEVMCVTCKIPLNVAEGPQPDRERDFIRGLIAAGKSKQEIKDALVVEYGPNVIAAPDKNGFGLTAYVVPLALLALLVAGLATLIPRWRRRAATAGQPSDATGPELSDEDALRLDADLARYGVTSSQAR